MAAEWERVRQVLEEWLELSESEQAAALERATAGADEPRELAEAVRDQLANARSDRR